MYFIDKSCTGSSDTLRLWDHMPLLLVLECGGSGGGGGGGGGGREKRYTLA